MLKRFSSEQFIFDTEECILWQDANRLDLSPGNYPEVIVLDHEESIIVYMRESSLLNEDPDGNYNTVIYVVLDSDDESLLHNELHIYNS